MKKIFYLATVMVAALAVSCAEKDSGETDNNQQQPETVTLEVVPEVVMLGGSEGSVATAQITSNSNDLSVEVNDAAKAWLSASVEGTTLTVTAKSVNASLENRNGVVTVYAGEGINTVNAEVVVSQEPGEAAADPEVSTDKTSVELGADEGSVAQVIVTSNVTDIKASRPEADTWFKVEVLNNTVTITATGDNTSGTERTSTVTITVTGNGKTASTTVAVTQAVKAALPDGPWQIGSRYQGGVLYWISEDGSTGKVLYPKRASALNWCTTKDAAYTFTHDKEDGRNNVAAMKVNDPTLQVYQAAKYCDDLEGDWYLPAINELVTLFEVYNGTTYADRTNTVPKDLSAEEKASRAAFDKYIKDCDPNGVLLNEAAESENGDGMWASSCGKMSDFKADYFRFGKANKFEGEASWTQTSRFTRCIKVVTAPVTEPVE